VISFIMCHRKHGNTNSDIPRFLQSLESAVDDPSNVEILIKMDDDDMEAVVPFSSITIKSVRTPRRRGYADLHLGYKDLMGMVDSRARFISAVADDFVCVRRGFDKEILAINREFCIIEGCKSHSFCSNDEFVDPNPFWSRALLDICAWDFGTFATDMWSHRIQSEVDGLSVFLGNKVFERVVDLSIDGRGGSRWNNERAEMIATVRGDSYKHLIAEQKRRINDKRSNSN
jgi:hypothetical protein